MQRALRLDEAFQLFHVMTNIVHISSDNVSIDAFIMSLWMK